MRHVGAEPPFRFSRTQRLRAETAYRTTVNGLRAVRHPNALLSSLVVLPVLVAGFSFGEKTAEARETAAIAGLCRRLGWLWRRCNHH
jgi:hypothetical protein